MTKLKIAVAGCGGRMGRMLIRTVQQSPDCALAAGYEAPGHPVIGKDAGAMAGGDTAGILVTADVQSAVEAAECVIDFTTPQATLAALRLPADKPRIHVIGTTGFSDAQEDEIRKAGERHVIVKAGNMSLGVNLLALLTKKVAAALDEAFDIEILEMHHRHKVDAPSGTALMLGKAAADGRGVSLADVADRARDGLTGPRKPGHIGFAVLRGGEVVGDHHVIFTSDDERIELVHRAQDRSIFARGAVKAALWAQGKTPGLYSIADVLGLDS